MGRNCWENNICHIYEVGVFVGNFAMLCDCQQERGQGVVIMTCAQVVVSVDVIANTPSQGQTHPDDHTSPGLTYTCMWECAEVLNSNTQVSTNAQFNFHFLHCSCTPKAMFNLPPSFFLFSCVSVQIETVQLDNEDVQTNFVGTNIRHTTQKVSMPCQFL